MADWLSFAPAVSVKPLWIDDGREVHLVDAHGVNLALKQWEKERLEGNTAQMHTEFKVRVSPLGSCPHIVVPLHVICSSEGGCCITYPYAGRSMDRVCADLRDAGQHDKLATQLAEMACSVVLTLQKLQASKPKAWVHRDIKLENLLLDDDGTVRVADCGNLAEEGDTTTAHDPTYFPPDWAALLPDGRHVFEDPASLAASNCVALDLRGLGMALIKGYAGKLPDAVSLEGAAAFSTSSSCSGSMSGAVSCAGASTCSITGSAASSGSLQAASAVQFDEQEKARLLRIANHDWAASIDKLVPASSAAALNQLAKLLMGPKESLPSLAQILQQPLIKAVHRQVLSTVRKARKPWAAHVAACRRAACHVLAPLMQLESQLLQVYSDGTLSSMPPLSEQFELLAEQYAAQQGREAPSSTLQEQQASHMRKAAEQQGLSDAEPVPAEDAAAQQEEQQCTEQQAAGLGGAEPVLVLAYCSSTVNSVSLFDGVEQDSPVSRELPKQVSATHHAVLQPARHGMGVGIAGSLAEGTSTYSHVAAECTEPDAPAAATNSCSEIMAEPSVAAAGALLLPAAASSITDNTAEQTLAVAASAPAAAAATADAATSGSVTAADAISGGPTDAKEASLQVGPLLLGLVDSANIDIELPSDLSAQQEAKVDAAAGASPVPWSLGCLDLPGQQVASPLTEGVHEQLSGAPLLLTYQPDTLNSVFVSEGVQHSSILSIGWPDMQASCLELSEQFGSAGTWSPAVAASSFLELLPGNTLTTGVAAAAAAPSTADSGCAATDAAGAGLLGLGDSSDLQLPSLLFSQQGAEADAAVAGLSSGSQLLVPYLRSTVDSSPSLDDTQQASILGLEFPMQAPSVQLSTTACGDRQPLSPAANRCSKHEAVHTFPSQVAAAAAAAALAASESFAYAQAAAEFPAHSGSAHSGDLQLAIAAGAPVMLAAQSSGLQQPMSSALQGTGVEGWGVDFSVFGEAADSNGVDGAAAKPMQVEPAGHLQLDTAGSVPEAQPVALSAAAHFGPGLSSSLISSLATDSTRYEPSADVVGALPGGVAAAGLIQLQPVSEVPFYSDGDQQMYSATMAPAQLAAAAAAGAAPGNSSSPASSMDGWSSQEGSPRSRAGSVQGFGLLTTGSNSWDAVVEILLPDALEADQYKQVGRVTGPLSLADSAWSGVSAPWWHKPPVGMGPAGEKAWADVHGTLQAASATAAQRGGSVSAKRCRSRPGMRSRIAAGLARWARSAAPATAVLLEALS